MYIEQHEGTGQTLQLTKVQFGIKSNIHQALVVLILFSLTPSHGRPKPIFPIPILTTLPALTETQLLWLMVGASGGAGVVLGAQGISNIAQVFFILYS